MSGRKTLDQKAMSAALNKSAGMMDAKQQAAWEIIQKMQALSVLIDYYTELEENHKARLRNDALEFLFKPDKVLKVSEDDFTNLLKMFKEATKFILERELVLQKYQKTLDSKNLLENDPIFQKVSSLNTRIKHAEAEKERLEKRNKSLEQEIDAVNELKKTIEDLKFSLKEKDMQIKALTFDLNQARTRILTLENSIGDLKSDLGMYEANVSQLNKSLELYNIPKIQIFDKKKLYQHNKILNILTDRKDCQCLLSYLDLVDMFNITSTCKLAKAFVTSNPGFFRIVSTNAIYDRQNLNQTIYTEQVRRFKEEILQQEQPLITAVKRYLYYNYNVQDFVETMIDESLAGLDKLKLDLSDRSKEEKGKVKSFFKSALNIKDDKPVPGFKFNKLKRIPVELQEKAVQMLSSTPFEKMTLLDTSKRSIEIHNPKEYRVTQNKMFKEEVDRKSTEFIMEFNNLIISMGESFESARDLCLFLVKEVGKVYSYLHIVLKEYHVLYKLKELLFTEMASYQMEAAINRLLLQKAQSNGMSEEYTTVQSVKFDITRSN